MAEYDFIEVDSAKIYSTLLNSLMDNVGEPLYPGDERRIMGDALAAVLVGMFSLFNDRAKQRTLRYARGAVLDAIGERLDVYRLDPAKAYATFRFSTSAAIAENIIIPAGTRITTNGSAYFATQATAVLPAGSMHIDLVAESTEGGSKYNGFAAGTVATLVDLIPFIAGAVNLTATVGGDDGEPYTTEGDERFRERIRLAPSRLSTAGPESAYRYHVLSADPEIIDVAFDVPEDEPNTIKIYPLMRGGDLPGAETLQKVVDAMADDVRPMTDLVQVFAPTPVEYDVELKYYCTKDDEAALIQAIEADGGAIDQYNAWQTTALDRDIDPDQLRSFVFAAKAATNATGTVRMDVVQPVYVPISKYQVPKFSGVLRVTHEVVTP